MKYVPDTGVPYPEDERPKLVLLENLFREWHQHFENNESALVGQDAGAMVFDGFYPHYFRQAKKLLFIGWETVGMYDSNYIESLHTIYRSETKRVGNRHLDSHRFLYRVTCIAYGILNGFKAWAEIPNASEIGDTLGDANGLSFAFMNISKMSNETGSTKADWPSMTAAIALSTQPRNFLREEVAILDPAIVITMNLRDEIVDVIGDYPCQFLHRSDQARSYRITINGQNRLLIDTAHFSARGRDDNTDFYVPICDEIIWSESQNIEL